jgi:antitoxin component of MazEF toxin-antitoxin module
MGDEMLTQVKARRVGDSVVITLTKPILEKTEISDGDSLLLEALAEGRILIAKEEKTVSIPKKLELELEVLKGRKDAIQAEMELAVHEHNNSMPTAHPGIEDDIIMEGSVREWTWQLRNVELEIAQKKLQLFELTGS